VLGVLRAALAGRPLQSGLYASADLERQLRVRCGGYQLVVVQMVRQAEALAVVPPERLFVDLIDALSLNFERRAQRQRGWAAPLLRVAIKAEARRLAKQERSVLLAAQGACVVSERDQEYLRAGLHSRAQSRRSTEVVSAESEDRGSRIGLGQTLYFVPLPVGLTSEPSATVPTTDLILTGNLGYWVNRDALGWWLDRVWPQLRALRPGVRMTVTGDRASESLARSLERAGVTLIRSPESLRQLLRGARCALAPMQGGAGVPVKILEAFAEGVPVVASPWAAAGVGTGPDVPVLRAERPDEWLSQISRVLDEVGVAESLSRRGRDFVRRRHSEEGCTRRLLNAVRASTMRGADV
jgi:glycosyltransferase involved in cell wall biosynthesis